MLVETPYIDGTTAPNFYRFVQIHGTLSLYMYSDSNAEQKAVLVYQYLRVNFSECASTPRQSAILRSQLLFGEIITIFR